MKGLANMKQTFDIHRFWHTMKWTVLTERKGLTTITVGFLAAFLIIQLFSCFTISDLGSGLGRDAALGAQISCMALLGFMQAYYASGLLGHARESRQRTTVLTLPASHLEKFLARLLFCLLVIPMLLFASLVCATGLRMLFELLAGHEGISTGIIFFGNATTGLNLSAFTQLISSAWSLSLFVLGGVLLRHRPFIWTCVSLVAGTILLFTLGFYIATFIGEHTITLIFNSLFMDMTLSTFELLFNLVLIVFICVNLWLSYKLFARLQVVQHKWFNL